ncbi:ligand of Numb protein X 2-like isoform X1 [Ischnura elegans]|uniref:ligand of Numb protein X 2-like isoform X1 n=1 Tax=Ischnura elegans TaxID=197161 RepID=UPI001ED87BA3|nr:ligand of Numb protein X 2-like isoform X1 [Ischnura elegans]
MTVSAAMHLSDAPYWARCPRDGQWGQRKRLAINVISDGITRLPVLEGEVSHIEIPRISSYLGITIVGGADTALRCIVVQDVYPEGLIGQDGRLRPGDQLVEINGADMTNTSHYQACQSLRKITPVLRLGVYREKVEAYNTRSSGMYIEEIHTVQVDGNSGGATGIRICDSLLDEPALFIAEVTDPKLLPLVQPYDRVLSINGQDSCDISAQLATQRIQEGRSVTLVVSRKRLDTEDIFDVKSKNKSGDTFFSKEETFKKYSEGLKYSGSGDAKKTSHPKLTPSHSALSYEYSKNHNLLALKNVPTNNNDILFDADGVIKLEDSNLKQRTVIIKKGVNESLGMRIGGGMGSSEGNIPIYIANIHPQGCVGRTQEILKGDILLSVCDTSLIGLTHGQAVATLKATVEMDQVKLTILEGPETSLGSFNFIPSWLYWQNLPTFLQYPKTVVLHRSSSESLGFSIVGGEDPIRGPEPIHVLYVVQDSPAAKDGKLRSGDRLIAVDGHSLASVKHSTAVSMLKETGPRVTLQVVSWMGTEL